MLILRACHGKTAATAAIRCVHKVANVGGCSRRKGFLSPVSLKLEKWRIGDPACLSVEGRMNGAGTPHIDGLSYLGIILLLIAGQTDLPANGCVVKHSALAKHPDTDTPCNCIYQSLPELPQGLAAGTGTLAEVAAYPRVRTQ